jgi:F-type H+-transporting ATPase subunit epsilon
MDRKIHYSIITPERIVYEGSADYIVVPAYDGEMGFLFNHAPLISELGIGEARFKDDDQVEFVAIHGGFVEITNNEITVLAEDAYKKEDIDIRLTEKKLEALLAAEKSKIYEERLRMEDEVRKLRLNLKLAAR